MAAFGDGRLRRVQARPDLRTPARGPRIPTWPAARAVVDAGASSAGRWARRNRWPFVTGRRWGALSARSGDGLARLGRGLLSARLADSAEAGGGDAARTISGFSWLCPLL